MAIRAQRPRAERFAQQVQAEARSPAEHYPLTRKEERGKKLSVCSLEVSLNRICLH